jgi:hypothetical protein
VPQLRPAASPLVLTHVQGCSGGSQQGPGHNPKGEQEQAAPGPPRTRPAALALACERVPLGAVNVAARGIQRAAKRRCVVARSHDVIARAAPGAAAHIVTRL